MDDESTFRSIYPALRRFAAATRPAGIDPDDLVQEALVRTLRRQPLSSLDDPLSYLRRVIHNLAVDERRRLGRRERWIRTQVPDEPTEDTHTSDLSDLLKLPSGDRSVLYLVVVERFSHDEAARALGITPAASRARMSRALRRLRIQDKVQEREA